MGYEVLPVLTVLASLVVAIVAMGAPGVSPPPQSQSPIRVVSSSHEVRFPDEVVFRMEAESNSPITEVALYYRLARLRVKVYGYPEFTPAMHVSTDFRLKTGGSSYLPTGVDIEYYYRIGDASGYTLETDKYLLEYRDPSFPWQKLRQGDMVVLWHDLPADRVKEVAANVDRRLDAVKEMLGLDEVPPMKAVVLSDRREARRAFPVVSDTASREHLFGGFAFQDYDLFVLAGLSEDGMVHEMAHLLLDEAVDSPLARVPAWLNEGLSMYFEAGSQQRAPTLAQAVRHGELLSLRAMNAVPGRPQDVRVFYAQSWSIVKYMIDAYGTERMTSMIGAIGAGVPIDEAVQQAYGISLGELDARWRAEITGSTPLAARPDPGTIATSAIITGAIAIALLVSAFRWLTHVARPSEPDPGF